MQEAYVQGVLTRSVDELVKAMGMSGISKSQVSRLCAEIDERVSAFLERPIEGRWPSLWLDATYVKVRRAGRIVSAAVIVAVGTNTEGRREVLGLAVGPSEAEPFWTDFLRSLARRGLRGVKLVISDAHQGLKAAVAKVLGAAQPVPGLCLAMEALRTPAMTLVESSITLAPACAPAPGAEQRRIVIAITTDLLTRPLDRQSPLSVQRAQSLDLEWKKRPYLSTRPGRRTLPRGHFTMSCRARSTRART